MKNLFLLFAIAGIFAITSCGSSDKDKKEQAKQDSIKKADSLAKAIVEVDSWDIYQIGSKDSVALKQKYGNKKLRVKNVVVNSMWSSKTIVQCLAYSPFDTLLSNPTREADPSKKIKMSQDVINGLTCRFNSEMYTPYYLELHFATPLKDDAVKNCEIKEVPEGIIRNYFSVITVEGENLCTRSNSFVLSNCVIK